MKAKAWALFDHIVDEAAPDGEHSNPWVQLDDDTLAYQPDFDTLVRLLGVPLHLRAKTTTGVPALALDVWIAYELRRAGFDEHAVWPRATAPRVLPAPVAKLLERVSNKEREALWKRLRSKTAPSGVAAASASILGKNYLKQVDVVMSSWEAGPEVLISTKRMDSSFGKNAANRVEESYGDAKNLRLRHPLAALGFVYGLRSTIFTEEPRKADWLIDLLGKLGREDDAYHAVCLIIIQYNDDLAVDSGADDQGDGEDPLAEAGLVEPNELAENEAEETEDIPTTEIEDVLAALPSVAIGHEKVPPKLQPAYFLEEMVRRVLDATPITMHDEARTRRRKAPRASTREN